MRGKRKFQYPVSILSILGVALLCFLLNDFIGYQAVALVLLLAVSLLALVFDIWPVLLAAILSAVIWNFFFIPPRFTFHIREAEDILMFLMYFMVALVHAVLTTKIKAQEKKARDKEEKEKAILLYNTLFNSLSHELKTPISTIIGAADTLKEQNQSLSDEAKQSLVDEIQIAGTRLHQQVENLLSMGRLESGMLKVNSDWCDMGDLLHSIVQKWDPLLQKRLRLQIGNQLPLFKLDAGLIEQVIFNIIQNAFQYAPPETLVELDVQYVDESCRITIADQGPGFPKNELDHIFEKFYRLPNTHTGGTGLGLSIAKGFTEAHNGTIRMENREEGGARCIITLPVETSFLNYIKHE